MSKKALIVLKDEVFDKLKEMAERDRRRLATYISIILEDYVGEQGSSKPAFEPPLSVPSPDKIPVKKPLYKQHEEAI